MAYPADDPLGLAADLGSEERLIAADRARLGDAALPADDRRRVARGVAARGPRPASSASSGCSACTSRATAAPGTSATAYGLACLELEAGDSGLRSFVSVQGSLAMFAIHRFGSEEQRERWLPAMAAGEVIGCFGLTEPDAGSDPGAMRTTARATATAGCSAARRCGSPTAAAPASRSCGRRPTRGSAASSCRRGPRGSARSTCTTSSRWSPRRPRS